MSTSLVAIDQAIGDILPPHLTTLIDSYKCTEVQAATSFRYHAFTVLDDGWGNIIPAGSWTTYTIITYSNVRHHHGVNDRRIEHPYLFMRAYSSILLFELFEV